MFPSPCLFVHFEILHQKVVMEMANFGGENPLIHKNKVLCSLEVVFDKKVMLIM